MQGINFCGFWQNHTGEVQRCAIGSLTFLKIWADWATFQFIAVDRVRIDATKSEQIRSSQALKMWCGMKFLFDFFPPFK